MQLQLSRLMPEKCALLVIDIQDKLMKVIHGRDSVVKNSILLIKTAKALGIPIVATTQYAARIGAFLPEIEEELQDVRPVDKMEFDCFGNSDIADRVQGLSSGVDTLLVCGVETHICIYQTVMGALLKEFNVWVPADAVSSRAPLNHETGLARIRDIGGVVANTELVIYELLQRAGTPVFKQLLPFLK